MDDKSKRWLHYVNESYQTAWDKDLKNIVAFLHGSLDPNKASPTNTNILTNFCSFAGMAIFDINNNNPGPAFATKYLIVSFSFFSNPRY